MNKENDDIFSKPYEEWPGNHLKKHEKRKSSIAFPAEAHADRVLLIYVSVAFCFWLVSSLLSDAFLGTGVFVQSDILKKLSLLFALSLALLVSLTILVLKVAKRIDCEWFLVVSSLPFNLFLGLFVWMGINSSASLFTIAVGKNEHGARLILYESNASSGRGCRIQNEFSLGGKEGKGFWCTSRHLRLGTYLVSIKSGSLGTVVPRLPVANMSE